MKITYKYIWSKANVVHFKSKQNVIRHIEYMRGFMESVGKCTRSNDYNLYMREFGETAVPTCSWHEKCRS